MKQLNPASFNELVLNGDKCLVMFSRKTCPVCAKVRPKLLDLEPDYKDVPFYNVDVVAYPNLQAKYRLKGVPHVLLFEDGEPVKRLTGNHDEDDYADMIEEN